MASHVLAHFTIGQVMSAESAQPYGSDTWWGSKVGQKAS